MRKMGGIKGMMAMLGKGGPGGGMAGLGDALGGPDLGAMLGKTPGLPGLPGPGGVPPQFRGGFGRK
jgi:signal recognition particle subunit SRP54